MPSLRSVLVVGGAVLIHVVGLWALNQGLLRPPLERIVSAKLLAEFITPAPPTPPAPAPQPAPAPPPAPMPAPPPPKPTPAKLTPPKPKPVVKPRPAPKPVPRPRPVFKPAPQPLAVQQAAAAAPVLPAEPRMPVPASEPAPVITDAPSTPPVPMVATAPPAPPVAAVVPPSSRAAYLNNPPPPYPSMSRRLGEAGRVVVRVLIGIDGRAEDARIQRSSGFERLDQVALQTARERWRYVPGTRGGMPEAMWFNVPINFVLE